MSSSIRRAGWPLFLLAALLFSALGSPAQTAAPSPWLTDLSAAQAQAKATNRPIVAVFSGSDWCKPCMMYEQEVFAQPAFAQYAQTRLVLAHFDFPRLKKNLLPRPSSNLTRAPLLSSTARATFRWPSSYRPRAKCWPKRATSAVVPRRLPLT